MVAHTDESYDNFCPLAVILAQCSPASVRLLVPLLPTAAGLIICRKPADINARVPFYFELTGSGPIPKK